MVALTSGSQSRSDWGGFETGYTLTGDGAEDVAMVALLQLEKTGAALLYSEEWCGDFVCDCAKLAGQDAAVPFSGLPETIMKHILSAGGSLVSVPQVGDYAFIDWNGAGGYEHAEIVCFVSHGILRAVGGNSGRRNVSTLYSRAVKLHTYSVEDPRFTCFVRPDYRV